MRAIAESLEEDWTKGKTLNLTANAPPTVADLFACESFFPKGSLRPRLCLPEEFDWNDCVARERELLESVEFCLPYFNSRLLFETANAVRLVKLPKIDADYLDLRSGVSPPKAVTCGTRKRVRRIIKADIFFKRCVTF